ncbi:MAG: DUF1003 domain-containing protein [Anaerolineae bacterium]|nr:DUF1003 domain-containing protein [Anaerolineae bacterium]MCO5191584.1 DUF1003 domain-containing protein [Anaerolineae bacterium]MCO5194733.1 DUF1003 domain-containing protein [Anaerolineae bacterium]MCO5198703.1 DUF1003 domain-containing protein [Anaerolineae bacterium]MCO5207921.1 DUF1003 domain-containing protein [Anaerolineae bacterium]
MKRDKNTTSPTTLDNLTTTERRVVQRLLRREFVSRNVEKEFDAQQTLGDRVADGVASFGGSWPFVIFFMVFLVTWIALNSLLLKKVGQQPFDPYPYILLNLMLSTLAAIQAPIILMSQNRQSEKDRIASINDFEVNLKSEAEIMSLHVKMDELREERWQSLVRQQDEQIKLLQNIIDKMGLVGATD